MESSKQDRGEVIYAFTTNGFTSNPIESIAMATAAGMFLMFVTISMGLPVFISMAALIGGILLVYGYKSGKVTYKLYADGLSLTTKNFIPFWLSKKVGHKWYAWEDVKSYRHDFDKTRTGGEYEYIKLYVDKSPGQIWITDQRNKAGFKLFKDNFLQLAALHQHVGYSPESTIPKSNRIGDENAEEKEQVKPTKQPYLAKRKSFYKTRFAKLLTIVFVIAAVYLLLLHAADGLSFRNLFRLEVIIIPGIFYMVYRVYVKAD